MKQILWHESLVVAVCRGAATGADPRAVENRDLDTLLMVVDLSHLSRTR